MRNKLATFNRFASKRNFQHQMHQKCSVLFESRISLKKEICFKKKLKTESKNITLPLTRDKHEWFKWHLFRCVFSNCCVSG